ncbi:FKBP-type peptidyl-prolyl cis-trans isomerase [Thiomicrorhabdus sp. 6S2-11]|uniref:Peptidyl-prolyl cis-trans isomerase n=1 Tax=Thiomicrorhabdus marina TaxID=2818442 RepID=A0ABS3Q764_9GAMM|nr:FKBP-type peptidyl-prolyl cis-trans isomerase [Thiomicrorhabdus marina]MBO1928117.1 FKBP-type peptidyl-prolyl cis-trans isomerase [Thiomicrorhabdus marina]
MRLPLITALLLTMQGTALANQATPNENNGALSLETVEEKTSYTLGVDLAKSLGDNGFVPNSRALAQGLLDALEGRPLLLTPEQMTAAIEETKKKLMAIKMEERNKLAEENLKKGNEFRAKFAKQDKTLTTEDGILYQVLEQGKGSSPTDEDSIYAHYEGSFINGEVFDSSYKRGRALKLYTSDVIKGWGKILKMMKPGSKWKVVIPPELAYGENGAGDVIGPNSTLVFTIELISFGKEQ